MGGIKDSQKMESSFFDALYVMPPLTNGGGITICHLCYESRVCCSKGLK